MLLSYPQTDTDCPCQSGLSFGQCCQAWLDKNSLLYPKTAEQLMRSRYCAYTLCDSEYLLKTWHPQYRPASLVLDDKDKGTNQQWIGLKIKQTIQGKENDHSGQVHFIARYKINGKAHRFEENSYFEKIDGQWFYLRAFSPT